MSARVQLNLSILPEEKAALQLLAETRGVSVTKMILSLVYDQPAPHVPPKASEPRIVRTEGVAVSSPADVPAAVERVAPSRAFTPFSKEAQAGRRPKEKR